MSDQTVPYAKTLYVYGGDPFNPKIVAKNPDGSVYDFVGNGWVNWRAAWSRFRGDDPSQAVQMTVDTSNASIGIIIATMTGAQTAALGYDGVWDLKADDSNGDTHVFVTGCTIYVPGVAA